MANDQQDHRPAGASAPATPGAQPPHDILPLSFGAVVPPAAQDPIRVMTEILENPKLSDRDKLRLVEFSHERFRNRRRMAYFSLYAIFAITAYLGLAIIVDVFVGESLMATIDEIGGVLMTIIGFLTGIVLAYYGAAALRPSS